MADFVHAAVLEQNFHNVEADLHGWVLQPVQVIERGAREPLAPFPVHCRRRPRPLLGRAGLDLDKDQAVLVSADEVNLAAWRAEVRGKKLQPIAFEVLSGCALSQFAVLEVERLLDPAQPGLDACRKVHAMPEQDFFDCSPASFYNCGVPKTNDLSAPVSRNCPVCAGNDALSHLQKGELHLVRCKTCGMIYANPVQAQFASGQHYDGLGAEYYLSPAKLESDYSAVRFERELRLFRKHCAAGAVLDVGCSSGAFLYQLKQRFPGCYDVLGTDVSGAPLDYAEVRGIPVIRGDFLEQPFTEKKFDAVTFWAVLEHLLEPRQFLEKARSILKPDGLCFVLVPNMKSLTARLLGARYRYIYPQHLNYFTSQTLRGLAEPSFSVVDFRSTHFNPIVIWQDWRLGGKDVPNAERAALLKRTTSYKQNPLLRPLQGLYALTEKALGCARLADNLAAVLRAGTAD